MGPGRGLETSPSAPAGDSPFLCPLDSWLKVVDADHGSRRQGLLAGWQSLIFLPWWLKGLYFRCLLCVCGTELKLQSCP